MKLATIDDVKEIMKCFQKYPDIFPHIRQDYITKMVSAKSVIFEDGVVLTFLKYKKKTRLGGINIYDGQWGMKQIVNVELGNGNAGKVLQKYIKQCDNDIFLTVREDNARAISFYKKFGFETISGISWKRGQIPGRVMKRKVQLWGDMGDTSKNQTI